MLDVFDLRERLIGDYATYVRSFIRIRDDRVRDTVDRELDAGVLWPEPLVQLNPSFQPAASIDELVDQDVLHQECRRIFRRKSPADDFGAELRLYQHQVDAIRAARAGRNYLLTTGTGSGKSLAYIVPIVDHVLRRGSGRGIQAIVVYPMNALANSQTIELEKFLRFGYPAGQEPVRFARYTGQESEEERQEIQANPPDILLTNYVMLELILTRRDDLPLVRAARGLRFLVLDELHTYRGRQGADVAMLVRRTRDLLDAQDMLCVGTSATLAGESTGSLAEQQASVAGVASDLFGATVQPADVIGETLRRVTPDLDQDNPVVTRALTERVHSRSAPPDEFRPFVADPLAVWVESTFGVTQEPDTGRLVRSRPRRLQGPEGAGEELQSLTGESLDDCIAAIRDTLLFGNDIHQPDTDLPVFAFRLHQFISRGDTVYASPEAEDVRFSTLYAQQFVPGGDRKKVLLPLVFCRECGQEYYSVFRERGDDGGFAYTSRDYLDRMDDTGRDAGFLFHSTANPWPDELEAIEQGRIPDAWLEERVDRPRVKTNSRKHLPRVVSVAPHGGESPSGAGLEMQFIPTPFRFCLSCGIEHAGRLGSEFARLSSLGSDARSTATTILTLGTVRTLRANDDLPAHARKLLSFTDNRQDASLQAGHFNDFVEIGLLRGAIYAAVRDAGSDGIGHDNLTFKVAEKLNLALTDYASNPNVEFRAKSETERALRDVLGYRLYHDLRRGWRVTLPNLEQCGLLEIRYESLDEVCAAEYVWQEMHPTLVTAAPETRMRVARTLLDFMRRELAIKVDYLQSDQLEQIGRRSNQWLKPPWAIDQDERPESATVLRPRPQKPHEKRDEALFVSGRGGFGQFLGRADTFPAHHGPRLVVDDRQTIILQLLSALERAGLVEVVAAARGPDDVPDYQLQSGVMRWIAGDGTRVARDPLRVPAAGTVDAQPNLFFVDYYSRTALANKGIEAREHTAQVPNEVRQEREDEFRAARLPILFCSPTMELGVDIAELNVVNMRNVPPTPANYAQRSGRAGRSGQPALVFTYCTTGSPHDQYYFKRQERMVMGVVTPPRLDLANEELVRSHVHALWLHETGQNLGRTLVGILDLAGDPPSRALLPDVRDSLENPGARERAAQRAGRVLGTIQAHLEHATWYDDDWINRTLNGAVDSFYRATDRWRGLHRSAVEQAQAQSKIILDATKSHTDKQQAEKLRRESEAQLKLLTDTDRLMQSDFYSYRYFASEGFLPGYSFPRLPLSAFIPGRRTPGSRDEFLQRPRFLAISEFGPRAIIYHEGARYEINKVILPVSSDEEPLTTAIKQCPGCGYIHPRADQPGGPDLCERCGAQLEPPLRRLFRLHNVSTRRRDRISSDEEERMRLGYEIRTGVRFATRHDRVSRITASVLANGTSLATMQWGQAATIWRINLGWRRRANANELGFVLDIERGYWQSRDAQAGDPEDPMSNRTSRVIPYVEDSRNCLLFEPAMPLSIEQMASLQAALKVAIQAAFNLEDGELAAEPLPERDERGLLLIYEAAEGGAGVLRRLLDEPRALARVAREALAICHFDRESGEDLKRATHARENCEAACYDCLMSYANQRDHPLLDRHLVHDLLLQLAGATVDASPAGSSPGEHLERLLALSQTELERRWLRFVHDGGYRMPDAAQKLVEAAGTRPDFLYEEQRVAIYVDGPFHDYPHRREGDRMKDDELLNEGIVSIRFAHDDEDGWRSTIAANDWLFGEGR